MLVEVAGRRWSGEQPAEAAGLATAMCAGPAARGKHACPVLDGGRCPLADEADAIIVLLDPDDERSEQLIRAHREQTPGTPVLVRHRNGDGGSDGITDAIAGCVEVESNGADTVAQVLALIGQRSGSAEQASTISEH